MAFVESDRVQLRHLTGFGALWLQAYPRLENAITAIQSTADGGTRPDSSTETFVKGLVTSAQSVEAKLAALWDEAEVGKAEEVTLDPYRGMLMLRAEGRRIVQSICRTLGMRGPRADVFANAKVSHHEDPFAPDDGP